MIATPYASGFDHFFIADEVQFKFDRCLRFLQDTVSYSIHFLQNDIYLSFWERVGVEEANSLKVLLVTGTRSSYFWHWPLIGICYPPVDWYTC